MSEGLAQGPYVAAGVGFKSATLRMQGTEPTTGMLCKVKFTVHVKVKLYVDKMGGLANPNRSMGHRQYIIERVNQVLWC